MKISLPSVNITTAGTHKWIIFMAAVIIQCSVLGYLGWRWHNINVDGIPYQWQCVPRLEMSAFGTDYIRVVFPEDTAPWLDDSVPDAGQPVYIQISQNEKGLLQIEGASAEKPGIGKDYMKAVAVAYDAGTIQFRVAFDRYRIAPELTDGIYSLTGNDSVIASIRMKKGEGVIEGIFVNGVPLENSSNAAAIEASRKGTQQEKTNDSLRIVRPGMVPPKEE